MTIHTCIQTHISHANYIQAGKNKKEKNNTILQLATHKLHAHTATAPLVNHLPHLVVSLSQSAFQTYEQHPAPSQIHSSMCHRLHSQRSLLLPPPPPPPPAGSRGHLHLRTRYYRAVIQKRTVLSAKNHICNDSDRLIFI